MSMRIKDRHDKLRELMIKYRLPADQYRAEGILKNVNTIEEYRALASDRKAIIKQAGKTVGHTTR